MSALPSRPVTEGRILRCKSIAKYEKYEMCHFLAPAGQPEMMHKNFMHRHLRFFVGQHACMKVHAASWPGRMRRRYQPMPIASARAQPMGTAAQMAVTPKPGSGASA